MGHIVVFEGSDHVPAYHRCEELADAVSFVEKLRNDRGVDKVNIFRTEEVRFDFRPYYRVELGALGAGARPIAAPAAVPAPAPAPPMAPAPPITAMAAPPETHAGEPTGYETDEDDDLSVGSGVRRGLFGR